MFTGIVEDLAEVKALAPPRDGVARLEVFTKLDLSGLGLGASVAVNGVCLTITAKRVAGPRGGRGTTFHADLGPETLARTTLGTLKPGAAVHVERALRLGDSLGGHMVAGHVDGLARVIESTPRGEAHELVLEAPGDLVSALVPKGSVTLDGVSLTVNWVKGRRFQVMLIPHTLSLTTLGRRAAGDHVNIETDLMAKHVIRVVELYMKAHQARPRTGGPRKPGTDVTKGAAKRRRQSLER